MALFKTVFIMPTTIITTDDLREFKLELLDDIKELLSKQIPGPKKRFIKSSEVMELLRISPGTLQNFRINGTLPFTKIGGIIYYDVVEIHQIMERNRVQQELNV